MDKDLYIVNTMGRDFIMTTDDKLKYDQDIGKGILAGLGYVPKQTLPLIANRIAARVQEQGGKIIDSDVTMVFKQDQTKAHLVTFATTEIQGEKVAIIYSAFGIIKGDKFKIDDADKAVVLQQADFNHIILHAHPTKCMSDVESFIKNILEEVENVMPKSSTDQTMERRVSSALRNALKTHSRPGMPLSEYDA